jgi:hypothetical protein
VCRLDVIRHDTGKVSLIMVMVLSCSMLTITRTSVAFTINSVATFPSRRGAPTLMLLAIFHISRAPSTVMHS